MRKISLITLVLVLIVVLGTMSFNVNRGTPNVNDLRLIYSSGNINKWPTPNLDDAIKATYKEIGLLDSMAYPIDNQYNIAKKELGKILFYDPRLSKSNQVACASCHDPQLGWGDGKRVAFGHNRQVGNRNSMTLFNVGYYNNFFWDGRSYSLEHQAMFPASDGLEMAGNLQNLTTKLKKYKAYEPLFKKAFNNGEISNENIFKAIATFERSIVSPKSRFDNFITGKADALTDDEVNGLHLYRTKARCVNCHNGGLFSDNKFHNDGQTLFASDNEDLGKYKRTNNKSDVGLFKTPSLRETANTGPWMHHGNFPSLKDVVQFYNLGNPSPIQKKYKGNRDSILPKTSPLLRKLNLTEQEILQVVAFLQTITTTPQRVKPITVFPK